MKLTILFSDLWEIISQSTTWVWNFCGSLFVSPISNLYRSLNVMCRAEVWKFTRICITKNSDFAWFLQKLVRKITFKCERKQPESQECRGALRKPNYKISNIPCCNPCCNAFPSYWYHYIKECRILKTHPIILWEDYHGSRASNVKIIKPNLVLKRRETHH